MKLTNNRLRTICTTVCTVAVMIFGVAPHALWAQSVDPKEQRIVQWVDAHLDDAIGLIQRTVDIDSPTENLQGVKNVGAELRKELEAIGMTARWIDMPAEQKRAGHLIAETKGTKGKRILMLGHLDTVLSGEKYRRDGDRVFGTGIGDMKGGNVVMVYALKALKAAGALDDSRVTVMFTGDEENSCDPVEICRGDMIAAAKRSDLALSFEAAVGNTATVGRRGSSSWRLEVEAKTGHSSGIFGSGMGYGAIYEAARILNEFREKLSGERYLTFNPSLIVGGTTAENPPETPDGKASGKTNVIPAKVIVKGDLRFISEEQKEATRNKMREIVAKSLNGVTSAKITFEDGIPAMTPVEGNYALLKKLDQVSKELGFGAVEALDPGSRGAGDIAFVSSSIIPGLDGIGMGGTTNSHAKGESASLENFAALIKRAAVLIYRLSREP